MERLLGHCQVLAGLLPVGSVAWMGFVYHQTEACRS